MSPVLHQILVSMVLSKQLFFKTFFWFTAALNFCRVYSVAFFCQSLALATYVAWYCLLCTGAVLLAAFDSHYPETIQFLCMREFVAWRCVQSCQWWLPEQPFSGAGEMRSLSGVVALRVLISCLGTCMLLVHPDKIPQSDQLLLYTAMVSSHAWLKRSAAMTSAGFSPNSSSVSRFMLLLNHAIFSVNYG